MTLEEEIEREISRLEHGERQAPNWRREMDALMDALQAEIAIASDSGNEEAVVASFNAKLSARRMYLAASEAERIGRPVVWITQIN